jgi:hypothetical protein
MATTKTGKNLLGLLDKTAKDIVGQSFSSIASDRGHTPVVLTVNSKKKSFAVAEGDLKESSVKVLTDPAKFQETDAGMRASADQALKIADDPMDVFLLNQEHAKKGDALKPLMAHEIAHYIEQTGIDHPAVDEVDQQNAEVVLNGFDDKVRSIHTRKWAELLCMAARRMVKQRKVSHKSVRAFLEAAIPKYDRPHWDGSRSKSCSDFGF